MKVMKDKNSNEYPYSPQSYHLSVLVPKNMARSLSTLIAVSVNKGTAQNSENGVKKEYKIVTSFGACKATVHKFRWWMKGRHLSKSNNDQNIP